VLNNASRNSKAVIKAAESKNADFEVVDDK